MSYKDINYKDMSINYKDMNWDICETNTWSIAACIAPLIKNKFRYILRGRWEYLDGTEWKQDKSKRYIKQFIQTDVIQIIMNRVLHWQKEGGDDVFLRENVVTRLLTLSNMLYRDQTVSEVISCLREFSEAS